MQLKVKYFLKMGSNSQHELKNTLTEKCAQQVVALQKAIIFFRLGCLLHV